jgi:hypothetical protein
MDEKIKKEKTEVVSFRISESLQKKLYSQSDAAGVSAKVWLEKAILENKTKIIAKQKPHPELRPLLFQVNKAGNNINQLAHHFNTMKLDGKITHDEYHVALDSLSDIQKIMREALDYAR